MMIWRDGIVSEITKSWPGAVELLVTLNSTETKNAPVRALAYPSITGEVKAGDRVLLTGSAVAKGLGTGGYYLVAGVPERLPVDPELTGHLMKARYTPLQFMVQGVDEQDTQFHDLLAEADDLTGMPVVCADLHSALPAVVAGIRAVQPRARIAYIMTDGGALPAWFSQSAAELKDRGAIIGTITAGQAFGGDLEAVNIYTALLAAKHVWNADVAIVAQGPGNLGTGTKWGFSGTQLAEAFTAAGVLNGRGIAALRISQADLRERHFGISHHSLTVLGRLVTHPTTIAVPSELAEINAPADLTTAISQQLSILATNPQLKFENISAVQAFDALTDFPFNYRTMGRNLQADQISFIAAAVAGIAAANLG